MRPLMITALARPTVNARWGWLLLLLLLQACSSLTPVPSEADLEGRDDALLALEQWQFEGKMGFRVPGESGSVYLDWRQQQDDYQIRLQGPLGQGAAEITGSPAGVLLVQGDQRWAGASAEALVQQQFGWRLPVSDLRYWLRGLPAPARGEVVELIRDEQGLLVSQAQGDWVLHYSQYQWVDGQAMPGRVKAEADTLGVRLTLVIKGWQLGGAND
ncbi:outer membrane lipoprotein LolB [Simiduia agarivorans SA1 = DSM 21679]|uniref:Outer-membrane lipoprotein LolB n=2 Tax=Simiduia TaxID=447467 RepID=K4KIS7_SIMAS|nr:outer membrane lipoprotein LolB [Simiduia agarivorans SA1 = DSM 21679]